MRCSRCQKELPNFEYAYNHIFKVHPSLAFTFLLSHVTANHSSERRYPWEERASPNQETNESEQT